MATSKGKGSFWPKVLEIAEKTELDTVRNTADDIQKVTGWECPVDRTSVNALCQLHEIYIDEKRWCTDEAASPSKLPKKWELWKKEKEKVSVFRLEPNIEQRTDLRKVFEERMLDSRVEFSL